MEYITFRQAFCENMITYLPNIYYNIRVKIEKNQNVFEQDKEQAFLMYEDVVLCKINIQNLFEMEQKKIQEMGLETYFTNLAESLVEVLMEAYEKHGIIAEEISTEKPMICMKDGNLYDFRCDKTEEMLKDVHFFDEIATKEQSDLFVVPFEEQIVIIPLKEMEAAVTKDYKQEILEEITKTMQLDIEHLGQDVLYYRWQQGFETV